MNLSLWISNRFRLSGGGGSGTGAFIAVAGVALSLIIMEFTLAVVVGFKDGIKERLMGFDAQVTIGPAVDKTPATPYVDNVAQLSAITDSLIPGSDISLALRMPGLLKTDDNFQGVVYVARNADADFTFERSNLVEGSWPDYAADSCADNIVISRPLARSLGLDIGSKVYSTFIVDGNIKLRRHKVAALYQSDFGEYDNNIVYASLPSLQRVAGIDSMAGTRIEIRNLPIDRIDAVTDSLQEVLFNAMTAGKIDYLYPVDNIMHSGALYFNWLALLDTNVVVIFVLMLCVAGLTLISSLFILILERVPDIGVLRAMGASKQLVRNIFVDMAMRLVGLGMIIGNVVALTLLLIQQHTQIVPLDPQMYYLSSVPVEIIPSAFVALNIGVAVIAWLVLILPARLASSIDPAKTVNYE